jgi:hypothetical protein
VMLGTQPSSRLSLRGQTRVLSHSYHNWLYHKNIVMRPSPHDSLCLWWVSLYLQFKSMGHVVIQILAICVGWSD